MGINTAQTECGYFYWYKLHNSELNVYFQSNTGELYKANGDFWERIKS